MNKELINKLEKLISDMDLPFYRKSIRSKDSIRWLNKNIDIKNANHKNIQLVKEILKELI